MGTINRHSPGCQCCGAAPCDPCDPCCENLPIFCYDTLDYSDDLVSGTLALVTTGTDPNCAQYFQWGYDGTPETLTNLTYATTGVDYIDCPPFGEFAVVGQSITDAQNDPYVLLFWDDVNCEYRVFVVANLWANASAIDSCEGFNSACGASSYEDRAGGYSYNNGFGVGDPIDCDNPVVTGTLYPTDPEEAEFCGLPASISYTLTFSHS